MYKIISASEEWLFDAVEKVEKEVTELKQEGWVEQGGVSISHSVAVYTYSPNQNFYTVAQAMVKK